jgi:hypothetical protein
VLLAISKPNDETQDLRKSTCAEELVVSNAYI